jgi:hypothetical protein
MYSLRLSLFYFICNEHVQPIDEIVIMLQESFNTIPPSGTKFPSTAGEEE